MVDLSKLKEEQLKLAKKVITTDGFEKIKTVAGCDQAYVGNKVISAIVVCDYKDKHQKYKMEQKNKKGNL